jgi:uncharacterized protein
MAHRSALLRIWLIGFLSAACGHKQAEPPRAVVAEQPEKSTPGLFLYEVRRNDSSVHLLGTMHVGFGFEEVLTDDARSRFAAASRVITEADVAAANPARLMEAALLSPERSLSNILGPENWTRLVTRMESQLPAPVLDRLEPWLPTVVLGLEDMQKALAELRPGADSRHMDVELMKAARAENKELAHFETVEEQIALFESIPLEEQVRELEEVLVGTNAGEARKLLDGFARGDERALAAAIFEQANASQASSFYERILYERNARWLPRIEQEAARGGVFIAVGAAHLLGERGIVHELRKRGYRVTRVG